jgi:hypothetical protein
MRWVVTTALLFAQVATIPFLGLEGCHRMPDQAAFTGLSATPDAAAV